MQVLGHQYNIYILLWQQKECALQLSQCTLRSPDNTSWWCTICHFGNPPDSWPPWTVGKATICYSHPKAKGATDTVVLIFWLHVTYPLNSSRQNKKNVWHGCLCRSKNGRSYVLQDKSKLIKPLHKFSERCVTKMITRLVLLTVFVSGECYQQTIDNWGLRGVGFCTTYNESQAHN